MAKKAARKQPASSRNNKPSRADQQRTERQLNQRKNVAGGSGSDQVDKPHCKFFPKGDLVPVELILKLDSELTGYHEFAQRQLNRPALLIYAQDAAYACCWFSRAIDLGDEAGNPATWMLQRFARNKWQLALRRVSGEIAAYQLESQQKLQPQHQQFPITLKRRHTTADFEWPRTITISQRG